MAEGNGGGELLDWGLCYSIHNMIDEASVEKLDPMVERQFSLICAVIDRVHDALIYINDHCDAPCCDERVLLFLVYACMVVDAVKQMHEAFGLKYPGDAYDNPDNYRFFGELIQEKPLSIPDDKLPTDDKFFEYFRSLAFAHPFKTNRPRFLDRANNEVQYSPFVIHAHSHGAAPGEEEMIGVRIYTSLREDIVDFRVQFDVIKDYVKSRYEYLVNVRERVRSIIDGQRAAWMRTPINRKQSPDRILGEMVKTLDARYVDGLAKDAFRFYSVPLTPGRADNEKWVGEYRKLMENALPSWCDRIDALDHEGLYEAMDPLVNPRVPIADCYNGVGYQLEKIFVHLGENNDYGAWAKLQLKTFSEGFAAKWVTITPDMGVDECHLLVTVACYFEFSRYVEAHKDAVVPEGMPPSASGAGIRRVVIGELPRVIKTL